LNPNPKRATPATADHATVLAFDFGTRKTGVAFGNTFVRVAHPLTTIQAETSARRLAAIDALVAEWAPGALVVGQSLDGDGSAHEMTVRSERFARQLEARYGLPVARVDERFTTRAASTVLGEAGVYGRAREAALDEVSAQVILQAWFDEPNPALTASP
jgi:putative Holliday junction resolvase